MMIKKILFAACMLLPLLPVAAQPALTRGVENKHVEPEQLASARYVGRLDGRDAWLREGKKNALQLVLTDVDLNERSTFEVRAPKQAECKVLAASCEGDGVGVLVAEQTNKRTVVLRYWMPSCVVPMATMVCDTVIVFDYGRKDECMLWGATSPSGKRNAMVGIVQLAEENQYYTYTALFDGWMRPLWSKQYDMGSLHDLLVTDEGRVVTFGEERGGDESHFIYNVFDSMSARTYDAAVKCDPVKEMHLVSVVGNYAVSVGTYHPFNVRNADKLTAGVLVLSFHLDAAVLAGVTMRPFQNEELNIFRNEKTKKIQKDQTCDHVTVLGTAATSYGAVMALGRQMMVEKSSDGGAVTREAYGMGVNVVAVDTTGDVRWVRNIRRNDVSKGDEMPTIGFAVADDKVCVVKSEPAKTPLIYELSEPAKRFEQGDKGKLMVYTIADDGTTEKLLLEQKTKHTVFKAIGRTDGTLMILSSNSNRSRLAELKW